MLLISGEIIPESRDRAKAKTTPSCGYYWRWKQGPMLKEQYCIGTWNVRSMNQGKLEVVKQEMARVNIEILVISELRWTGMGALNSDDH